MTVAALLIVVILLLAAVGLVIAVVAFGGGKTYAGDAPYKGKVSRFTGTSSKIVEEDGTQRGSSVTQ